MHLLAGVGGNQAESSIDRVAVRVDEPGEKTLALQVDALGICGRRLYDLGKVADRDDLVAANRNRLRVRILRIAGKHFGMKEDSFGGASLCPQRGIGLNKKEGRNQ